MFRRRGRYRQVDATSDDGRPSVAVGESQGVDRSRYASEISSSLSLQILIYYNGLTSVAFLGAEGVLVAQKLKNYKFESSLQNMILAPVLVLWAVTEVHRFYFGYQGNIREMVPHMCAFLLTTIFPQMFCLTFLSFFQEHRFPADPIIGSILLGFLAMEVVVGYHGIKAIINKRTAQFFRVAQEEFLLRPEGMDHPRAL